MASMVLCMPGLHQRVQELMEPVIGGALVLYKGSARRFTMEALLTAMATSVRHTKCIPLMIMIIQRTGSRYEFISLAMWLKQKVHLSSVYLALLRYSEAPGMIN